MKLTKIDILREMQEVNFNNLIAYSKNVLAEEPKNGYEFEWRKSKERVDLTKEMIEEEQEREKNSYGKNETFFKKVCSQYMNAIDNQILLEDKTNNCIIHAYLSDYAIDLNLGNKINIDNYKDYLYDKENESIYKFNSYEEFYNSFVKNCIIEEIKEESEYFDNGYEFRISREDMIKLGFEDEILEYEQNNKENEIEQEEEI